jgi:hypothetical protein
MSSFSFDNWDQLLDPQPTPSITTAVSLLPTPSTVSSGEFQPYVAVGLNLAGGDRKLFSLLSGARTTGLCCGVIGSSKFCLKALDKCGVYQEIRRESSVLLLKRERASSFH